MFVVNNINGSKAQAFTHSIVASYFISCIYGVNGSVNDGGRSKMVLEGILNRTWKCWTVVSANVPRVLLVE